MSLCTWHQHSMLMWWALQLRVPGKGRDHSMTEHTQRQTLALAARTEPLHSWGQAHAYVHHVQPITPALRPLPHPHPTPCAEDSLLFCRIKRHGQQQGLHLHRLDLQTGKLGSSWLLAVEPAMQAVSPAFAYDARLGQVYYKPDLSSSQVLQYTVRGEGGGAAAQHNSL